MSQHGDANTRRWPNNGKVVVQKGALGLLEEVELMRAIAGMRGLTQYELRVLLAIASMINDRKGDVAFPPHAQLAAMLGIQTRHAARAIGGLKAKNLLVITEAGNSRRANHYRVNADRILDSFGASTGDAATRLEGLLDPLYGRIRAACDGVSPAPAEATQDTPEQASKGQQSRSEAQAKLRAKLSRKMPAGRYASAHWPSAARDAPPGGQKEDEPPSSTNSPYDIFSD
jgi:hypothetical protein